MANTFAQMQAHPSSGVQHGNHPMKPEGNVDLNQQMAAMNLGITSNAGMQSSLHSQNAVLNGLPNGASTNSLSGPVTSASSIKEVVNVPHNLQKTAGPGFQFGSESYSYNKGALGSHLIADTLHQPLNQKMPSAGEEEKLFTHNRPDQSLYETNREMHGNSPTSEPHSSASQPFSSQSIYSSNQVKLSYSASVPRPVGMASPSIPGITTVSPSLQSHAPFSPRMATSSSVGISSSGPQGMHISWPSGMPSSHGMTPTYPPRMSPSGLPGMPPSNPPGMPPSYPPGMPPSGPPGMPPSGPPGMSPSDPPGISPLDPPGMPPSGSPEMSPSGPTRMSPPGVPSSVPLRAPLSSVGMPSSGPMGIAPTRSQGMPPYRSQGIPSSGPQGMPSSGPQGMPSSGPQGMHSSGPQGMHSSGPQLILPPGSHGIPPPSSQGMPPSGPQGMFPSGPQGVNLSGPSFRGIPPVSQGMHPSGPQGMPPSGPQGMHPSGPQGMHPSGPQGMPPSGPQGMPSSGPQGIPPSGPQGMPPSEPQGMPPSGPQGMPPSGPQGMPPSGPQGMPPSGPQGMPPSGPQGMPPSGLQGMPPSGLQGMPPSGPQGMPPSGLQGMPPSGPQGMPPSGPQRMPPSGPKTVSLPGSPGVPSSGALTSPLGPSSMQPPGFQDRPPGGPLSGTSNMQLPGMHQINQNQQANIIGAMSYSSSGPPMNYPAPPVMNAQKPQMPVPNIPPSQVPTQFKTVGQSQQPGMAQQTLANQQTAMPLSGIAGSQQPYPGMQSRYPGTGAQSQGRRLNPDDMPSPLQVMEEDQKGRRGDFITNAKGALPPLVTTDFIVKDGGNASPRFIRSTMYSIPSTPDMMKQTSVPFGIILTPMADQKPEEGTLYIGTSLANGPVRCLRCKGYMSPLMVFMDGGRRYQCQLCHQINEVPSEYYCHMDSQGARADKYQRPELCLGTFEYVATAEYCREKELPKEPAFIFVLEMSQMMLQRGVISMICQNMHSLLEGLPVDQLAGIDKRTVQVGFITYDSTVHFYKLTGQSPEMCIVCDKENMFVPVPDGVLCNVDEVSVNIERLMENIPQNFESSKENSGVLMCAIQAGVSALKASGRAGKLFVFHSSLPQSEGPGKLRNRDDRKLLGTEKEKSIMTPQSNAYSSLGQDLVAVGASVDLYIFNDAYVDVATIGQVCRLTGGQCYKYTYFQANKDGSRFLNDLRLNISQNIAFDAVMRVRTSSGVRAVDFYGHFYMSNTTDIELATVDSSKALAVEIKHDDKLTEEDGVYLQAALLYTSVSGQRRLRIMSLALNTCTQMAELYKNCDLDTLMNFFGKQTMVKFLETSAKQVKEALILRTAQILACYRKNCSSPSSSGQLILPELMKLLPLYANSLTKCDALSGGQDLTCDEKAWLVLQLLTMPIEKSVAYFYPRLLPLMEVDSLEEGVLPMAIRASYERMQNEGIFLLENSLFLFLWVGSNTNATWMMDVFGVAAPHQLDPIMAELPDIDNLRSKKIRTIVKILREERKVHLRLIVVPQQGKHEVVFKNYLVEDKGVYGAPSYVDFLCHIHKEIRSLLS